jgi:predicted glycoside hydrolase/deacetylase ChbG (UPF0249 family)
VKVVFHADDFGLTPAVNAGIVEAHERGVLGSTSLMVTAAAADDAAAQARATPGLDVGLHLTLVEERPAAPPAEIPSLLANGRFWPHHTVVARRYLLGRWRPREAARELEAQWERFAALGLHPSHCDGHQHLHLLPGLLPAVIGQAVARDVRCVRTRLADPLGGGAPLPRSLVLLAIRAVGRLAWLGVGEERHTLVPFATVGFLQAGGTLGRPALLGMLDALRRPGGPDVVEVMLHPGHGDADTVRRYGHWHYQWDNDLALLLDPALPEELARRDIAVTSFREISAGGA